MSADDEQRTVDPLVREAATLLSKAMVSTADRDAQWECFRVLVSEEVKQLEEAPIRWALDELERQGYKPDALARVLAERLGQPLVEPAAHSSAGRPAVRRRRSGGRTRRT